MKILILKEILFGKKYVFGIKINLVEFFLLITYDTICYVMWIIFIYPFYIFLIFH